MTELLDLPTLSPGTKRDHEGQPVQHNDSSTVGSTSSAIRASSPALSNASSSLTELSTPAVSIALDANPGASPAKKRKLTFAEREVERAVKRREKEERAQQRAEEKARRDEEKRLKDEEKRKKAEERDETRRLKEVEKAEKDAVRQVKEAERLEKRKAKDAEKAEKDAEKAKRETERLKKERAQMRLGAFFVRPAAASSPPSTPDDVSSGVPSRRSSIASIDMEKPEVDMKTLVPSNAEYSKWILPFFTHDDIDVAPANRFLRDRSAVDGEEPLLGTQSALEQIEPISRRFGRAKRRFRKFQPVRDTVAEVTGSALTPIDLTNDGTGSRPLDRLAKVPYKILSFREDVRPPYQGTYTRVVSPRSTRKLSRLPTYRGLPAVDYDYDSEAEWQEPEADDEDLGDEDELSEDEDDAEEMADFLDDENEIAKRRVLASDAEPICTGLCWQGDTEKMVAGIDLTLYKLDFMHDNQKLPIDPYSTEHWSIASKSTPLKPKNESSKARDDSPAMQPPRMPLTSLAPNVSPLRAFVKVTPSTDEPGQKENNVPPSVQKQQVKKSNKPVKTIPPEVLPSFKAAVSGSDLNKVALIEILKKQFPKCSKDAIKGTLETVAERRGTKEADKRWVLLA